MVKQVLQLLNQEIKHKVCTMCTHYIQFDNHISVCNKHLTKNPFHQEQL